jgi:threonylcarbamoyladenosine tRNA methylthiotransferase MtaB
MTSFSIQTFGCRVNQAEAFWWTDTLQKEGLKFEKDFVRSDWVVINSCTLTSRADSDARSFIRRMSRLNPSARLIVTGCYAEKLPEEFQKMPQVWRVITNSKKKNLPEEILSLADTQKKQSISPFRSRALVKIQDGCNFRCTFCVIPSVRGKSVSFGKREILVRIEELVTQGFKEIILTGIHLSSYGVDHEPKSSLEELLHEITSIKDLTRVRLSSLDPRFLKPSLMEFITANRKICPHFHLSLQSGSDAILSRMGRKVSVEQYEEILSILREKSPSASLGADIIVGFPEETEDEFEHTHNFLKLSPLTYFHVFSYSARPGTVAASFPQVNGRVKKERATFLRSLSRTKDAGFRRLCVGKKWNAVIVKKGKTQDEALTSNYIKVHLPCSSCAEKDEVKLIITEVQERKTRGHVIDRPNKK